jgi:hypothetical protein
MLRRVALVRTDDSEDRINSVIRVTRIVEVGTTLVVTSNRSTLRRILCHFDDGSDTFFGNEVTWRNIPEDGMLRGWPCSTAIHYEFA